MKKEMADRAKALADELRQQLTFDASIDILAFYIVAYEELDADLNEAIESGRKLGEMAKNGSERAVELADFSIFSSKLAGAALERVLEGARKDLKRKALARKGADAIHQENRAMKAIVFKWLDDNGATYEGRGKGKGIEAAARAIAKQQPIVHATARDWYKQWKKLHPASTL